MSVRAASGVGLIEVMVALFVVAVGLLSASRLQLAALQGARESDTRAAVSLVLEGVAERARANAAGLDAGLYDDLDTADAGDVPACIAQASGCTAAERAETDLAWWAERLVGNRTAGIVPVAPAGAVPAGTMVDNADGSWTATVSWREGNADDPREQSLSIVVRP